MTRNFLHLPVALVLLFLGGCTLIPAEPPLRIGTSPSLAPLVFLENGEVAGLEADLAAEVERRTGRRIQWQLKPFADLLPALQQGEVDVVMAGVSVTPARQRQVSFTRPYMDSGLMAVMRRQDLGRLNSPGAVRQAGRRIAVETGSVAQDWVQRQLPSATVIAADGEDALVAALRSGRADYLVMDAPAVWYLTGNPGAGDLVAWYQFLDRQPLAWAVRAEAASLQQTLDGVLDEMRRDGTLAALLQKWVPMRMEVQAP